MRRQIIVVFLSLFWLALAPASATDRGALFKVSGGGHSMYLFGTMHVGLPEFYPLEPRIAHAVAAASTLALEVDPEQPAEVTEKALRDHAMAAAGFVMPAPLAARLSRVLGKGGIDPAAVAPFKPWMVAVILTVQDVAGQGYLPNLAVDAYLSGLAHAGKVKVISLESAELQMAMFDRLSAAEQLRFLDESIGSIESGKARVEMREIVDAWRTADRKGLDALAEKLESDKTFSGRFTRQVLLAERNPGLADKLMQLLAQENNTVAAIGVLHLLGKNSVPDLMRARGLTVERVY
jgi:uncharacterized protein YbaP (TraB family)